jgi:hypothetical protein
MFLYAQLVIENLAQQARRIDLVKELQSDVFPHGLQAAFVNSQVCDGAKPSSSGLGTRELFAEW